MRKKSKASSAEKRRRHDMLLLAGPAFKSSTRHCARNDGLDRHFRALAPMTASDSVRLQLSRQEPAAPGHQFCAGFYKTRAFATSLSPTGRPVFLQAGLGRRSKSCQSGPNRAGLSLSPRAGFSGLVFLAFDFQVSLKLLRRLVDAGRTIDDTWPLVPGSLVHRRHEVFCLLRSLLEPREGALANTPVRERSHVVIIIYGRKSRAERNHDWPEQVVLQQILISLGRHMYLRGEIVAFRWVGEALQRGNRRRLVSKVASGRPVPRQHFFRRLLQKCRCPS